MFTIDWERTGRRAGRFFLFLLEYCFKFFATVVAGIILAADGSFSTKLATGFGSLSQVIRKVLGTPREIGNMATVINDYNTLTAADFNAKYGADAVNGVLSYLNEGIVYFQDVYYNLTSQPFSTIFAVGVAFSVLYLLARVLRFARQKGQGSVLVQLERKLGDRVFNSGTQYKPTPQPRPEQKPVERNHLRPKIKKSKIHPGLYPDK